jgi:hypothetical protein
MHVSEQPPSAHKKPGSHLVPHAPQLFGSRCVSKHIVPHFVVPPPHASEHMPIEQTSAFVVLHELLHMPQFEGSR